MAVLKGRRKIYVPSSWRFIQSVVIRALREMGHGVAEGDRGFSWSEIDGGWEQWDFDRCLEALDHPIAETRFDANFDAMKWADTFVLVQPCSRSSHLEMGWAVGAGKDTVVMLGPSIEPELMVKMCDHICSGPGSVLDLFELFDEKP